MFSRINVLSIDLDHAFTSGIAYSLAYYAFYGFARGIEVPFSSALIRGLEFFVAQCLSEVVVKNLSHSTIDMVRYVKVETRIDVLAALLMAMWTAYSLTGSPFSIGFYPSVFGLAAVSDILGGVLCRAINHEKIVGLEESLAVQASDVKGKLEFRPQMASAPIAIDESPAF